MPWDLARSEALHAEVVRFIRGERARSFDELATSIARHQAESSPPIARLWGARGRSPSKIDSASEIPAVPTDAFKLARIAAHPPALDIRTFHTSGTTSGARGSHALRRLDTYEEAARRWADGRLFDRSSPPFDVVALLPSPSVAIDSSLSFMAGVFAADLGNDATFHVREGAIQVDEAAAAIERSRSRGHRVLLLATSFALVHFFDAIASPPTLPPGSRVMPTGGTKGKSREVSAEALLAETCAKLGIPASSVVAEYGMTELSSQAYAVGRAPYVAPPWMRVTAVDPVSLDALPKGEIGIARVVDLANVDSAVAIQTHDRVREIGDGFEILGRLPGATPRGCSLAIEELLGR